MQGHILYMLSITEGWDLGDYKLHGVRNCSWHQAALYCNSCIHSATCNYYALCIHMHRKVVN